MSKPQKIASAGVVGAGVMGQGIAAANVKRGIPVAHHGLPARRRSPAACRACSNEVAYNKQIERPGREAGRSTWRRS